MLGMRWSLARGLSKTEQAQLTDGLGLAGTSKGAMDIGEGIDRGLGQSTELKLKYHLQPIDLIDFSCKSSLDNEHPHGKKYRG